MQMIKIATFIIFSKNKYILLFINYKWLYEIINCFLMQLAIFRRLFCNIVVITVNKYLKKIKIQGRQIS